MKDRKNEELNKENVMNKKIIISALLLTSLGMRGMRELRGLDTPALMEKMTAAIEEFKRVQAPRTHDRFKLHFIREALAFARKVDSWIDTERDMRRRIERIAVKKISFFERKSLEKEAKKLLADFNDIVGILSGKCNKFDFMMEFYRRKRQQPEGFDDFYNAIYKLRDGISSPFLQMYRNIWGLFKSHQIKVK